MHFSPRRKHQVITLACLLGIIVLMTLWYVISKPRRDADHLLQALQHVQVGQTHAGELTQIFRETGVAGASPKGTCPPDVSSSPSAGAPGAECNYQLSVTNKFLNRLRLAPVAGIVANIGISGGTVTELQMFSSIGEYGNTADVQFFQVEGHPTECGRLSCVRRLNASDGAPWKILITVSSAAPLAERNSLLGLRTSCFSKIGGCKNVRELLPISADN